MFSGGWSKPLSTCHTNPPEGPTIGAFYPSPYASASWREEKADTSGILLVFGVRLKNLQLFGLRTASGSVTRASVLLSLCFISIRGVYRTEWSVLESDPHRHSPGELVFVGFNSLFRSSFSCGSSRFVFFNLSISETLDAYPSLYRMTHCFSSLLLASSIFSQPMFQSRFFGIAFTGPFNKLVLGGPLHPAYTSPPIDPL